MRAQCSGLGAMIPRKLLAKWRHQRRPFDGIPSCHGTFLLGHPALIPSDTPHLYQLFLVGRIGDVLLDQLTTA